MDKLGKPTHYFNLARIGTYLNFATTKTQRGHETVRETLAQSTDRVQEFFFSNQNAL